MNGTLQVPAYQETVMHDRPRARATRAATSIDDYLADVTDDKRIVLMRLRDQIRAAVPTATEAISYGRPAFRLGERYFPGFSATKRSCSFYAGRAPV